MENKIKIGASFSHKQNLGNYESAEASAWMEQEVGDVNLIQEVYAGMYKICQIEVMTQLNKFRIGRQPQNQGMSAKERVDKVQEGAEGDFGPVIAV